MLIEINVNQSINVRLPILHVVKKIAVLGSQPTQPQRKCSIYTNLFKIVENEGLFWPQRSAP